MSSTRNFWLLPALFAPGQNRSDSRQTDVGRCLGADLFQFSAEFVRPHQVPLLIANCIEGHVAVSPDHEQTWLLTKRHKAAGHVIGFKNCAIRIGQKREWIDVGVKVFFETGNIIGSNGHNLGAVCSQGLMSLTQLRKVLSAIRSKEPSQEDQDYRPIFHCV
jgi:hypothetical protein